MKKTTILLATVAIFISGCATSAGNAVSSAGCPSPTTQSSEYLIGPGDTLEIVVWRNEELSATVPVRPDGRISTPLIDDIQAAGKSPSQLGMEMEIVLSEYLRTPEVSVMVIGQGIANQIQVLGEVNNPQAIAYRQGLRLLDVLVTVGGLTDFAAGNRAKVVRQTEMGQVECNVHLKDLTKGDLSENIQIFPGDVLVVPETRF